MVEQSRESPAGHRNGEPVKMERRERARREGRRAGGSVSPVLANVYLHYALDLWFEKDYRKSCKGKAKLIRYADDFIACLTNREDAMEFPAALGERFVRPQ